MKKLKKLNVRKRKVDQQLQLVVSVSETVMLIVMMKVVSLDGLVRRHQEDV